LTERKIVCYSCKVTCIKERVIMITNKELKKRALAILENDHELSRLRNDDPEQVSLTIVNHIECDLGRELTEQEYDFLIDNF